jgi:lysophospholipase L1-like esterase
MFVIVAVISSVCAAIALAARHLERVSAVFAPQFYTDTRKHQPATCPANATVIVTFGQSLAANSHEHVYNKPPNQDIYLYFSGRCFYLADPLMGATGEGGSVWFPAASKLAGLTGRPVVVIAGGVDGTAIQQWTSPDSPLVAPLRARVDEAKRSGLPPNVYVWMQGENDAIRGTSAASYQGHLKRLFRLFPDAPWLITSNSICTNTPSRSSGLDEARRNFAQSTPGVEVSVDLDSLGLDYRMNDRCHFNQRGQELAGIMIANAVAPLVKK